MDESVGEMLNLNETHLGSELTYALEQTQVRIENGSSGNVFTYRCRAPQAIYHCSKQASMPVNATYQV